MYILLMLINVIDSSNKPLQWSICSNEDQSKTNAGTAQLNEDDDAPSSSWVKVLKQLGNNKLILALDMPSRGNFLRDFMLRASPDLEQVCLTIIQIFI